MSKTAKTTKNVQTTATDQHAQRRKLVVWINMNNMDKL